MARLAEPPAGKIQPGGAEVRILINAMTDPIGLRLGTPGRFPRKKLLRELGSAGDS